jgi:hypothetical protein
LGKGTLIVLFVLVAGLLALLLAREREIARGGPALDEYPLCPELSAERVRAVRLEHLQRSIQMRFERDAAGRWFLTDPLAYPAQAPLLRTLLKTLEDARGEPAPEADPAQVGLEPPAVVLELLQVEGTGERKLRVELGALDVDSSLVYARIPGHPSAVAGGGEVFRTTRVLMNTLERNPDDYRDRRATTLLPQDVISLRRRGQAVLERDHVPTELYFDALLGPDGWKRVTQPTVSLDPSAMGLLVRGATDLAVERFVDDSPQDLSRYGLEPPRLTIELEPLSGSPVVLAFGHPPTAAEVPVGELTWYCQRRGYGHVWEVGARDVELLTRPADLFFDQAVVRMLRADVARLELEGAGARSVLVRERKGWSVGEGGADAAGAARSPGDVSAIEEALALLERAQLGEHLEGEAFEPAEPPCSFAVLLASGARLGGALGRPTRDPRSGAQGRQFLRDGDEVVALVDEQVFALCQRALEEFRSRRVHQIQESLVRAIELELAGKGTTYTFVNTGDNVWNPKGQTLRAPQGFVRSLDGLLNLAARRWLADLPEHQPLLAVRVLPLAGADPVEPRRFSFARAADGAYLCTTESGQVAEVDGALVEQLLALF